jgi:general secretion pathway protein F
MPAFEYVALDPTGRRHRGALEGESGGHVRQLLRDRGLTLLDIAEIERRRESPAAPSLFGPRIGLARLALVTRLLGTLIKSGLPLDDALTAVAEQADDATVRRVFLRVRSGVLEGQGLAASMQDCGAVFPDIYLATIGAGEQTPHLDLVLDRLADYLEEQQQLRQKITVAMLYPLVLTVTAALIVTGLLTYVVPEVTRVFERMDRELPALTRALIAVADYVRDYGAYTFAALVLGALLARAACRRPAVAAWLARRLLAAPLIGRLIRETNSARFARTLSILLGSGVSMLDALRITSRALTSAPLRDAIAAATARVREGMSLAQALRQTGQLPQLTLHLIASGEASGTLERMLDTAARSHERAVQNLVATLLALVEPALILTMGVTVLLIVVAIMLPIFDLNRLV